MQQQFGSEVNFVGVAGRDSVEEMLGFVNNTGVTGFDHNADESGDVWATYGITSQPAFVFVNDDGTSDVVVAALGEERLIEHVEELIAG